MSARFSILAALLLTGCPPATEDKPTDTGETDAPVDADGDGYAADVDCNDSNAAIHPDAAEMCDPGDVDEDCNGVADSADAGLTDGTPAYHDGDGDGYGDPGEPVSVCEVGVGYIEDGTDCDDDNGDVNPGAVEVCDPDDVDEDCSGAADDADDGVAGTSTFYADADGDGLGDAHAPVAACDEGTGVVSDATDCDDTSAVVAGPTGWYADVDADGYGDPSVRADACAAPPNYVADATDCDDADGAINPGAEETCGLGDEDCDGLEDDADASLDLSTAPTWYADADGDGLGDADTTRAACAVPGGYLSDATDCDDTSAAIGGATAWYQDADADGYGDAAERVEACTAASGHVADFTDCVDTDAGVNPGATEMCDGADDDCDGVTDEDDAADAATWYSDSDGDGFGNPAASVIACESPSAHVSDATDCDDTDASVSSDATEMCNGADDDCDGMSDEDDAADAATWYADSDGDGFGDLSASVVACEPPIAYGSDATDCDDADAAVNPDATEVCSDGVDDDCSGSDTTCEDDYPVDAYYDAKLYGADANGYFGWSMSGDIDYDQDGNDDLVVGAYNTASSTGAVYVFAGPLSTGEHAAESLHYLKYRGTSPAMGVGYKVWSLGDANNDGDPELASQRYGSSSYILAGGDAGSYVFYSNYDSVTTGDEIAALGAFEAGVSGDEIAYGQSTSSSSTGQVSVVRFSSSGAWGAAVFSTFTGESLGDQAGVSISGASDLDGDGADDMVVGAPGDDDGGTNAGAVYVVLGSDTGVSASLSTADAKLIGGGIADAFGTRVQVIDDSDLDGLGDILVGASAADAGGAGAGVVYLFESSLGFSGGGSIGASDASAVIVGADSGDGIGAYVVSSGDVNGDAEADYLVGSPLSDVAALNGGACWLVHGPIAGTVDLQTDWEARYLGENASDGLCQSGLIFGDSDGDGLDDIALGAPLGDATSATDYGAVWIFLGAP